MSIPGMSIPIGQRLRQARQARNLTIEQVARATHLRPHHIQAIEEGHSEAFPSPVQLRAFLRVYADYLGLTPETLTADLAGQNVQPSAPSTDAETQNISETSPRTGPAVEPLPPAGQSVTSESLPEERQPPDQTAETVFEDSQAIFRSIGETLRRQRELVSLALEDVAGQIHLRPRALQALEAGNFQALPSPVQARGMLSSYAQFLGLDAEALLLRFAEGLQRQHQERLAASASRQSSPRRPPKRRLPPFLSPDLIGGASVILILFGVVIWGAHRIELLQQSAVLTATLPSVSEVLLDTSAAPVEATASPPEGTLPAVEDTSLPPATAAVEGNVQVVILAMQRVWVRVLVDERVALEGRLLPGQAYPFGGETRIEVLTGNGAAIRIFYNQRDIGLAGSPGEVVDLIFTSEGLLTPTPTVTPTPTTSPTPTITPRPSPTPRSSPTPRP